MIRKMMANPPKLLWLAIQNILNLKRKSKKKKMKMVLKVTRKNLFKLILKKNKIVLKWNN